MRIAIIGITALACSLLCGCSVSSSATGGKKSIALCAPNRDIPISASLDTSAVQSIVVDDSWMGLSLVAPIVARYELHRADMGFVGQAKFSVGAELPNKPPSKATEQLAVPQDVISRFLDQIATTPVTGGKYEPKFTHTDDYPSVNIELRTDTGFVALYSASQSKDFSPWKITNDKTECISQSGTPATALALLEPYFKRDVQKALIEREQNAVKDLMKNPQ